MDESVPQLAHPSCLEDDFNFGRFYHLPV